MPHSVLFFWEKKINCKCDSTRDFLLGETPLWHFMVQEEMIHLLGPSTGRHDNRAPSGNLGVTPGVSRRKTHQAGSQTDLDLSFNPTFTNCVTLGKLSKLSEYRFSNPRNQDSHIHAWGLNTVVYFKHPKEHLAHPGAQKIKEQVNSAPHTSAVFAFFGEEKSHGIHGENV